MVNDLSAAALEYSSQSDPSKAHPINLASKISFLEATVLRRSTIDLKKASSISDERIVEIVKHSLLHGPSPFHVQSGGAVVLLYQEHEKFWDMAYEAAKKVTPEAIFNARFIPNLKAYRESYGTVSRRVDDSSFSWGEV